MLIGQKWRGTFYSWPPGFMGACRDHDKRGSFGSGGRYGWWWLPILCLRFCKWSCFMGIINSDVGTNINSAPFQWRKWCIWPSINHKLNKIMCQCICLCAYLQENRLKGSLNMYSLYINCILGVFTNGNSVPGWGTVSCVGVFRVLNDLYWSSIFDWIGCGDIAIPCRS